MRVTVPNCKTEVGCVRFQVVLRSFSLPAFSCRLPLSAQKCTHTHTRMPRPKLATVETATCGFRKDPAYIRPLSKSLFLSRVRSYLPTFLSFFLPSFLPFCFLVSFACSFCRKPFGVRTSWCSAWPSSWRKRPPSAPI